MEPSSSSSAATASSRKKRKNKAPEAHEEAKRLKADPGGDEAPQCGRPSGSPRISPLLDRLQQPITLTELTELLHFAALGKKGGIKQPSWCRLSHQRKVGGLNIVIVEGLTQSDFYKNYLTMKHLRTNYTSRVTFTPSSNNVASEIFSRELPKVDFLSFSKPDEKLHRAVKHHPVITTYGTRRRGLTAFLLSQEEKMKNHYPIEGMPAFEDFVSTDSAESVTNCSPLYGLDCEMCQTEKGYELTRVSLVDSDGNCVLDDLVKPQNRVFNYLTKFSGITPAMLRPIKTTLQDVQAKLKMLLPRDAVLVGHSLNNDLVALKLIHQHVIDTSLLYRREFGRKFKLKVLAETILKRQIQMEEKNGHNPTEDAVAALELAQYFIKTGPRKVVELHLEELWGYKIEEESTDCTSAPAPSYRFADILQTLGRSVAFSGKRADISLDLSNQHWYNSDKEVLASFRKQTKSSYLSVLQFSSFAAHLTRRFPHQEQLYRSVCANLRDMCVVFAGPLPAGFTKREVRQLFRCCGPVRKIQMLNTSFRVHAEVEFELLEGATLALKTLNGLCVLGQPIKVQRPMCESMLDLDLNLDTLLGDTLNTNLLYAAKLSPHVAERVKFNGHALDAKCSGVTGVKTANGSLPAKINGKQLQLTTTSSKLSEENVREMFSRFGALESVILPAKLEKRARYACIKFESSEGKHAALSSSEDLLKDNYLICPSLTPPHLPSWAAVTTALTTREAGGVAAGEQRTACMNNSSEARIRSNPFFFCDAMVWFHLVPTRFKHRSWDCSDSQPVLTTTLLESKI
ncbi:RNA exonuclease 5-like isoform X1 [Leuresthes tenuis]|uniref:RNA exonuclease 5-like isoform X1 n=1 Tax=Leuresthes tenuis TaxID=355514 RepID=UPI003B508A8A